jgi:hypothetical protein
VTYKLSHLYCWASLDAFMQGRPVRLNAVGTRLPCTPATLNHCSIYRFQSALRRSCIARASKRVVAAETTEERSPGWLLDEAIYKITDRQDAVKESSREYERTVRWCWCRCVEAPDIRAFEPCFPAVTIGCDSLPRPALQISNFTFGRWSSHRSTARYVRHMKSLFQSSIIRGLTGPLLSVASVSTLVCMYEDLLADGTLPDWLPSFYLPTAPFDLTSFALALLLVFRTNTSYDRWLEVCTVWGGIANRARDTMRQVISHLSDQDGFSPMAAAMCRWVIAYARSLKAELVPDCDLESELQEVLTPVELRELIDARHRPSFALSVGSLCTTMCVPGFNQTTSHSPSVRYRF